MSESVRSRRTRQLAEAALVRIVRCYGSVPEFVLLGGLVPDLLCTRTDTLHAGTTDVDVQVDLEIAGGSANAARLEAALRNAGFTPDQERVWRWQDDTGPGLVVKVELLADLDDVPDHATLRFDHCDHLGAVNLRGSGFAGRDWEIRPITSDFNGEAITVGLRVAGVAGYLLAKIHAAYGRRATKDWYDIAYVLLHNDHGGPRAAGERVRDRFGRDLVGRTRTALDDLASNFAVPDCQGAEAYADTTLAMYGALDRDVVANDAVAAILGFTGSLDLEH